MSMPKSDSDVVLMQPGQGSEREERKEMGLWETHLVRSQEINLSLSELTWHIAFNTVLKNRASETSKIDVFSVNTVYSLMASRRETVA